MADLIIPKKVVIFKDVSGKELLMLWLKKLDKETQRIVKSRLLRLKLGNFVSRTN